MMWGFWVMVTFSPLIVTTAMFALGLGFKIGVWAGTLLLAFFGFFKAQRSVVRMRSLAAEDEIENWLATVRRDRTARRLNASRQAGFSDHWETASNTKWALARGWTQFRRHAFWWEIKKSKLTQHVGDLFHLLGLDVRKMGQSLFVNNDTLVAVVNGNAKSAPQMADLLSRLVAEKASCRTGILISPFGFKLNTYRQFKDAPLILLDAANLAALSRRYIG